VQLLPGAPYVGREVTAMIQPYDVCIRCHDKPSTRGVEIADYVLTPEHYEKCCSGGIVWYCPSPPSPHESDLFGNIEKAEPYPPAWCPWRAELLMLKDVGKDCPEKTL